MEFDIHKKDILKKEEENYPKEEIDLAYKFAFAMKEEFQDFIKSIVLFGSTARKAKKTDDIDILIILDDVMVEFNKAIVQGYRVLTQNIIQKVSKRLHVTSMRLTNFWDYVRSGDPVAVNILREGIAIIDTGIFNPAKVLLYQGRIKPSKESVNNYVARSEYSLNSSKNHVLAGCVDLYWSAMDVAEALLMKHNEIPPNPAQVHHLLDEKFINKGLLEKKYSIILQELYHLNKAITHNEITYIPGEQYTKYLHDAEDFVKEVKKLIEKD